MSVGMQAEAQAAKRVVVDEIRDSIRATVAIQAARAAASQEDRRQRTLQRQREDAAAFEAMQASRPNSYRSSVSSFGLTLRTPRRKGGSGGVSYFSEQALHQCEETGTALVLGAEHVPASAQSNPALPPYALIAEPASADDERRELERDAGGCEQTGGGSAVEAAAPMDHERGVASAATSPLAKGVTSPSCESFLSLELPLNMDARLSASPPRRGIGHNGSLDSLVGMGAELSKLSLISQGDSEAESVSSLLEVEVGGSTVIPACKTPSTTTVTSPWGGRSSPGATPRRPSTATHAVATSSTSGGMRGSMLVRQPLTGRSSVGQPAPQRRPASAQERARDDIARAAARGASLRAVYELSVGTRAVAFAGAKLSPREAMIETANAAAAVATASAATTAAGCGPGARLAQQSLTDWTEAYWEAPCAPSSPSSPSPLRSPPSNRSSVRAHTPLTPASLGAPVPLLHPQHPTSKTPIMHPSPQSAPHARPSTAYTPCAIAMTPPPHRSTTRPQTASPAQRLSHHQTLVAATAAMTAKANSRPAPSVDAASSHPSSARRVLPTTSPAVSAAAFATSPSGSPFAATAASALPPQIATRMRSASPPTLQSRGGAVTAAAVRTPTATVSAGHVRDDARSEAIRRPVSGVSPTPEDLFRPASALGFEPSFARLRLEEQEAEADAEMYRALAAAAGRVSSAGRDSPLPAGCIEKFAAAAAAAALGAPLSSSLGMANHPSPSSRPASSLSRPTSSFSIRSPSSRPTSSSPAARGHSPTRRSPTLTAASVSALIRPSTAAAATPRQHVRRAPPVQQQQNQVEQTEEEAEMHLHAEAEVSQEAATDAGVDVESVTHTLTTKQLRREVRAAVRAPHVARGSAVGSGDAETSRADSAQVSTTTGDRDRRHLTEAMQPSAAVRRPRPRTAAASPRTADSRALVRSAGVCSAEALRRPVSATPTSAKQVRSRSSRQPPSPASQMPLDCHYVPGARTSPLPLSPLHSRASTSARVAWRSSPRMFVQGCRAGMQSGDAGHLKRMYLCMSHMDWGRAYLSALLLLLRMRPRVRQLTCWDMMAQTRRRSHCWRGHARVGRR